MGRVLAGMRIRKKLVFLHTCFSLVLAGVLALAMRPSIREVVREAEVHEAVVLLDLVMVERERAGKDGPAAREEAMRILRARLGPSVVIREGDAAALGVDAAELARSQGAAYGAVVSRAGNGESMMAVVFDAESDGYVGVSVVLEGARRAVVRLYIVATIALLAVYALVALTLELFVLPQHVYGPISTILRADEAVREGRAESELIAEEAMPADELGEIMHSRNESIRSIRRHESDLAAAMSQLASVADDLRRKNHLLEMARRNLADADRLASLGMMSAGIAHELNTPLAVLKGMVERLNQGFVNGNLGTGMASTAGGIGAEEAALMLRVVGRLERLSESLLDFARVRPHRSLNVEVRPLADEAWTLVRLDREARDVELTTEIDPTLRAWCDPDRIVQVLVNLLRNAVDSVNSGGSSPAVRVVGRRVERDNESGRWWVSLTISDNGPGLSAEILSRLFQPFASTRLDARGTGLGLAVADGIVREHGGVILARNRPEGGAEFEVVLPEGAGAVGSAEDLAQPRPEPPR